MPSRKKWNPEVVILRALDGAGAIVEEHELNLDEDHDGLQDLIDSDQYRASRGIVIIEGLLFSPSGRLQFRNRYTGDGVYAGGRTVHPDGTVIDD